MKDDTARWASFADENLEVAILARRHGHLNACLQNAQQAVEKYLKALIVEVDAEFRHTHSIRERLGILATKGKTVSLSEEEIDLMDAIYVPSKYPVYSALPHADPDPEICDDAISIAQKAKDIVSGMLRTNE